MRDGAPEIAALGARLVLVLCQDGEAVGRHFAADPPPFDVAIDGGREAARAWGVYRLLGLDGIHLAKPATFVIDGAGVVRRRFVGRFQWQSLPLSEILGALREMA